MPSAVHGEGSRDQVSRFCTAWGDAMSYSRAGGSRHDKTGFTLMELLVVISIIAVLASMLLVGIGVVRRAAQLANCSSNLRQLSLGCTGYAIDNDGFMLPFLYTQLNGNQIWYSDFLYPYMEMNSTAASSKQRKNVYVCAAGKRMKFISEGGYTDWTWNYGLNTAIHQNYFAPNFSTCHQSQINRPAETMHIADGSQRSSGNTSLRSSGGIFVFGNWKANDEFYDDDVAWSSIMSSETPDEYSGILRYRHGGQGYGGQLVNVAWADGHVAPVQHHMLVKSKNFAANLL